MPCVPEDELLGYLEGRLAPSAVAHVESHLRGCDECRLLLAETAPDTGSQASAGERTLAGRYQLIGPVGAGGMGVVYAAHDLRLGRKVALKVLRPDANSGTDLAARMLREAKAMAGLSHPNILTVYEVSSFGDQVFLAMELVEGGTLAAWLKQAPRSWREIVAVFISAAEGLAAAHAAGIVHRDFKPDNVLVGVDGRVRVTDFGLAASTARASSGGSPAYMAPEQIRGESVDGLADLFSFCVSLHEALYGERPAAGRLPAPPRRSPVPKPIRRVLLKGLQPGPEQRFSSMPELISALKLASRPRRTAYLIAGAAMVACVALLLSYSHRSKEHASVLVADVLNQTGEPSLDGLSGMLITSLEQSKRLSVLTRSQVFDIVKQLGRKNLDRIDEPLGREIGQRDRMNALVLASVQRFGDVYALDVKVVDPAKGSNLFAAGERGHGKESIPGSIDRISERIREALNGGAPDPDATKAGIGQATTANLEAYQHYFLAEQILDKGGFADPSSELRKAIALDPTFALAQYRLGVWLDYQRREASGPLGMALRYVDRVPEKERLYIRAFEARVKGRNDEAQALYRELLRAYPAEKEAQFLIGDVLYVARDYPTAARQFRKTLELEPQSARTWIALLWTYWKMRDLEAALETAVQFVALVPSTESYDWLGRAYAAKRRFAEAEQAYRRSSELFPSAPAGEVGLANLRLLRDDYDGAETLFSKLTHSANAKSARDGHRGLAMVSAYRGRYREASRHLDDAIEIDRQLRDSIDIALAHAAKALWLARGAGDAASTEREIDAGLANLDPERDPELDYRHFYWYAVYAELLVGRLDKAAALSAKSQHFGRDHGDPVVEFETLRAQGREMEALRVWDRWFQRTWDGHFHYHLAELHLRRGENDEALADAQQLIDAVPVPHPDSLVIRAALYPRVYLLLAGAYRAKGDAPSAARALTRLQLLWKDADPDSVDLREAKRELARLRR